MAQRIKRLIDLEPYLGYRMVWARLHGEGIHVNRKTVQRLMQHQGWQCHPRFRRGCGKRVEVSQSTSQISNVRWAADTTCG